MPRVYQAESYRRVFLHTRRATQSLFLWWNGCPPPGGREIDAYFIFRPDSISGCVYFDSVVCVLDVDIWRVCTYISDIITVAAYVGGCRTVKISGACCCRRMRNPNGVDARARPPRYRVINRRRRLNSLGGASRKVACPAG